MNLFANSMMPWTIALLVMCPLFTSCTYLRGRNELPDMTGFSLEQVKQDIRPLTLSETYVPTQAITDYFRFYDPIRPSRSIILVSWQSEGQTLVGHIFVPPKPPRGTLYLLHGYFDHTGTLSKLIAEALLHQYAIVAWDLPGHGLSSGERTDTGEFDLCARQFIDIIGRADGHLPRPFTWSPTAPDAPFPSSTYTGLRTMRLMASSSSHPLFSMNTPVGGDFLCNRKPVKKQMRRVVRNNSSDQAYLAFVRKDPLHSPVLSFAYLEDLYRWNEAVADYPIWPGSLLIVQGEEDTTVDWDHNLAFLRAKIPDLETHLLPGAKQPARQRTRGAPPTGI